MKCSSCGSEGPPGKKFCSKCGTNLTGEAQACPACGAMNLLDSTLCRLCGTSLVILKQEAREQGGDLPSVPEVKEPPILCARCGTDNPQDKRFCRRCGARLVEPAQRIAELAAEVASMRDSLSELPPSIVAQELATIRDLEERLTQARQAFDNGGIASAAQLLTATEQRSSELAASAVRLRETAGLIEQAEHRQERIADAIAEAKESMPLLTLVKTSPLEKAIQRCETRLASGSKALQQHQFKRAEMLLGSAKAEKELKALNDKLIASQAKQREMETLLEQLEELHANLKVRLDAMRQEIAALGLESPETKRKLALLDNKLSQSQAMMDKGDVERARQMINAISANLDALDKDQLSKVMKQKDRQALELGLAQQSGALRERMNILREDLENLTYLDPERELRSLSQLDAKLGSSGTGARSKAEGELNEIRQALHELRRRLPELHHMEKQIPDLLARVTALRDRYEILRRKVVGLDEAESASQVKLIDENLSQLTAALASTRFSGTQLLEELLNKIEDPDLLEKEITTKVETREGTAQLLTQARARVDALTQDLREAEQEGAVLHQEEEALAQIRAMLGRVEELQLQGRTREASSVLQEVEVGRFDELRNRIEDELTRTKLPRLKTTLSLTKMPDAGGVTNYSVMLNISGGGWHDASSIQGNIKVACRDRVDIRKALDDLTTVINVLFGAHATLRGKMPEVPENQALDSLSELGDLMYRLFLPIPIQRHLSKAESPILIASNDLELPWELMCPENEFLCLRAPVARMPVMREFPRRNEYTREEKLRFLFIANPTGDLPATEEEVEWIVDRLSDEPATVEVWRGAEATGLKLHRALASGRYDVIHYSGHAYFNLENPDESGLVLAGQNIFIAQTIQRTLRGRPLVLLNACESGREMMVDGEVSYTASETEGLASSFIRGGALGIIGTLWPIFDEGAAEFASTFYEKLLAGQNLGEAMRRARLHVRETRPHDVTWASFVLYGDPTLNLLD